MVRAVENQCVIEFKERNHTALLTVSAPQLLGKNGTTIMIHQLRIYEIFEHNKSAFHARFRDHAMRIMQKYGFEIIAMWEAKNHQRTEFVYLLVWPDEMTKSAAWSRFMADEEWKEIKRVTSAQYGDMVGSIEDRVLQLTNYSAPFPPALQKNR